MAPAALAACLLGTAPLPAQTPRPLRPRRPQHRRPRHPRRPNPAHRLGSQPPARRQALAPSRPAPHPVRKVPPRRRLPPRHHQSAAGQLVLPHRDLEQERPRRRRHRHRPRRGPAGHPLPRARNRRRLLHPPLRRPRPPRHLRPRLPGPRRGRLRAGPHREIPRPHPPRPALRPQGPRRALRPPRPHPQPQAQRRLLQAPRRPPVQLPHPEPASRPCSTTATVRPSSPRSPPAPTPTSSAPPAHTSLAGGGNYSAYVGAVVDLVRITSSLHTAQYQYIPAIAFPQDAALNLRLNTPPSFHNPKSVIVIGLPAIQAAVASASAPARTRKQSPACSSPTSSFPSRARHSSSPPPSPTTSSSMCTQPDHPAPPPPTSPSPPTPFSGGLVLNPNRAKQAPATHEALTPGARPATRPRSRARPRAPSRRIVTGSITGFWGFDPFTGPTIQLQDTPGKDWKIAATDPLIAGRENHLLLTSTGSACVQKITLEATPGQQIEATFKPSDKPNVISVDLPLKSADPGSLHLAIHQYGETHPETVGHQDLLRARHPRQPRAPRRRQVRSAHRHQPRSGPADVARRPHLHPLRRTL